MSSSRQGEEPSTPTDNSTIIYKSIQARAQHLMTFSTSRDKARDFLSSFDMVMTDFEGNIDHIQRILWSFGIPIDGASAGVSELKNIGKHIKYVTNNSIYNDMEYAEKLKDMGITDVKIYDIEYPLKSIASYLKRYRKLQKIYSLCSREANEIFSDTGCSVYSSDPITDITPENIVHKFELDGKMSAVIYDMNINITFHQLGMAKRYLENSDCYLIVGGSETFTPLSPSMNTIGTASFINMLHEFCKSDILVMGRPGPMLGEELRIKYDIIRPERVLFIGTSLVNDVQFAQSCNYKTLLILGGQVNNFTRIENELKPDYLADGLRDFVDVIKAAEL